MRLGDGLVDPRYASFYLGHPAVQDWIERHAHGATMPNLNTSILGEVPFVLPSLSEQRIIADILSALDDKIELNRRMSQTLEEIARALFKSWFVDFDPVHAKAAGRQPVGMDAETAALFPSEFKESELGLVPKGWTVSTIGEEVDVLGGSTPSTAEPAYWEGGTNAWATPKDLAGLREPILTRTERCITDAGVQQISSRQLPPGTVLMSSRAPVGYLAISAIPISINQGFIAMVCNRSLSAHYVLCWAHENMGAIRGMANGTTFQEISKKNFRPLPVLVPPKDILCRFDEQAIALFQRIEAAMSESQTLESLRDQLLPRLVSGELLPPIGIEERAEPDVQSTLRNDWDMF